ncbi:ATP-dependent nuclease subunit B [Streptococcus phocae]|uniref:ATP-dependent helicase/deoxyribonuclease subunit B n=1 Tax=Streptococcus phocae TaxID=119224 RepID=A0A0P6SD98_9STRE|nr:ATP-dependent nuclease subunit B [Streptococcus phocae]KPJ22025.1 ATP-dependent helicase [Streptococcus phocae]
MKLLYTDIAHSLTDILVKEAKGYADEGLRVFYIAPNSLSFEKERAVLELLPEQGSFLITVTRFSQMAHYLTLSKSISKESLDDNDLSMIMYRALMTLNEDQLKVFNRLRTDQAFIKQLVDLYKELKQAQLTAFDLTGLENPDKQADFITIFNRVDAIIAQGNYDQDSQLSHLAEAIQSGDLDDALRKTVVIIDGFSRFSAEEDHLLTLLHAKCHDIVVGSYISQKAYQQSFIQGNIYQASVDFMTSLAQTFQTKPIYRSSEMVFDPSFSRLTQLFEAGHDYSVLDQTLSEEDKSKVTIWQNISQKEEIEHVAKAIRQKLQDGYRYKDMLVLLGDVDAYQLQVGHLFDKFEIPYYFGKTESMSAHPLVQFIESLERSLRYNWRRDDIVNLLKSGLYGNFLEKDLDQLEYYLDFADIKGFTKFSRPFSINSSRHYPLERLDQIRLEVVTPLQQLFKSQKQLGSSLLKKLTSFFKTIRLSENIITLSSNRSEAEMDRDEEVWKTFVGILESFHRIFGMEKMTLSDCLSLIKAGMQAANYRTVPATVDVVSVTSYDLVEPHSRPFVFAIGLSQSHFPKQVTNTSLISDQERALINEATETHQRFEIPTAENLKKNHQTALSLFNAATSELVLSTPLSLNEVPQEMSPYLEELISFGVPLVEKGKNLLSTSPEDIGNYKSLLSRLIDINRQAISEEMTDEDRTFWTVALRYLKRRLREEDMVIPTFENHLATKPLDAKVIEARFPSDQPIRLSSSALTIFYNNEYKYFLDYVLRLQELESIHPDARIHGQYLHRVFELVMQDQRDLPFDDKLGEAIQQTNQQSTFLQAYHDDAEGQYSLEVLEDIARAAARALPTDQNLQVLRQEAPFEWDLDENVVVRGMIDRVDRLPDGSLGIIDYKSSANTFDIEQFYNGLSPQLITYLAALANGSDDKDSASLFGAMYLHLQEPKLELAKFKQLDNKLVEAIHKELTYKGIFMEAKKEFLANGSYAIKQSLYSPEEIETLLDVNQKLYQSAAQRIRQGHFVINPYTKDGKSVQGDQLKAITRFEADLDLGQARRLVTFPARQKRQAFFELMMTEDKNDDI